MLSDKRTVSLNKLDLGIVCCLQHRFDEALQIYDELIGVFESLGEPGTVADVWYQIGIVHRQTAQFEQAEHAYRESLAIRVRQKELPGEATCLNELGRLYDAMGRLEEAVSCYEQAAIIYSRLQNQRNEGFVRDNLADTLVKLCRYAEARREVQSGIDCLEPYGHAGEPWKAWRRVEEATENPNAAAQARQEAIRCYLAYRRANGQSVEFGAQSCALVAGAIDQGQSSECQKALEPLSLSALPPSNSLLMTKLQSILRGDRDPALVTDPNLDYRDAVELQLLLEALK